ncbi:uncharacterized protein LOC108027871 [Drosophila biarmipes]|uniref:uncharacterized protein LOC108027871 n=1 Tax=Drosophila biarmipes TaxID=125945 RepID=UPI001CDAC136|nr:uncharacterized protein LOC108027871 [Drosophila biarmipes]
MCSTFSGVAYESLREFRFCSSAAVPMGSVFSCPKGYYCTANPVTCSKNATFAACTGCNRCSSDHRFACTSRNTYSVCMESETPISSICGTCFGDYVCNLENPNICGSPWLWKASCNGGDTETCATVDSSTEYCRSIRRSGRYPYVEESSVSLKRYVYCYFSGKQYYGKVYSCPGSTFFDSSTQSCTTQKDPTSYAILNDKLLL